MGARSLIDAPHAPDVAGLDAALRADVRFHSPCTDYEGRAVVAHLLRIIAQVLHDVRADERDAPAAGENRAAPDSTDTRMTRFTAAVRGAPAQGVLCEDFDASGKLAEAVLFVRPYRELRTSIRMMRELLDEAPLPDRDA